MTTPPAHTTLPPDPSHPITNPPGSSQTHTNGSPSDQSSSGRSGSTSSKTGKPSSTDTGGGGGGGKGGPGNNENPFSGSGTNKTAIALGTLFGVLGFATGVAFVVWYLRRRHARSGHAFDPLGDDEEEPPHSLPLSVSVVCARWARASLQCPLDKLSESRDNYSLYHPRPRVITGWQIQGDNGCGGQLLIPERFIGQH